MFGTLCGEEACPFQGPLCPSCCACPRTAPTAPARHLSALCASPGKKIKKNKKNKKMVLAFCFQRYVPRITSIQVSKMGACIFHV
jgi:hypothetical protein